MASKTITSKTSLFAAAAFALALTLLMSLAGCAGTASKNAASPATDSSGALDATPPASTDSAAQSTEVPKGSMQVKVSIVSPDGGNKVEYNDTVVIPKGSTALDSLNPTGLALDVQESEMGPFVKSIGGLANEGMNGWSFTVNTDQPTSGASDVVLKDGDLVEWAYIDMSK